MAKKNLILFSKKANNFPRLFGKIIIISTLLLILCYCICNYYKFLPQQSKPNQPLELWQQQLKHTPVRSNLAPQVQQYLQSHKVFIACTSSPQRIAHLAQVLQTLDLREISAILVALPFQYARTKQTYQIPETLELQYPKLKLLRIPQDLGPITKLLPAIEYAKKIDPQAIVITIDDDMLYPFGMVQEMIHHLVLTESVVAGVAYNIGKGATKSLDPAASPWANQGILFKLKAFINNNFMWRKLGLKTRQFIAGFGGVAYRVDWLDLAKLTTLSQLNQACFKSDDLVISYVLAKQKIPVARLANHYFNLDLMLPLEYGTQADALHKLDPNEAKYLACYKAIVAYEVERGDFVGLRPTPHVTQGS